MVKFKIEAESYTHILKYIQAPGRNIKGEDKPFIDDCLIQIFKNELKSVSTDKEHNALVIDVTYKLTDVEQMGNLPVVFEKFNSIAKRFNSKDIVTIEYIDSTNKLIHSRDKPKLVINDKTIEEEKIESAYESNDFKFDEIQNCWVGKKSGFKIDSYLKVNASEFKEIVDDGEQIKRRSFPFTSIGGKIEVIVEDEENGTSIVREIKTIKQDIKSDFKSIYTLGFGNVFSRLDGEIEIWIANNSPMVVRKKTDKLDLIYVLATLQTESEPPKSTEKEKTKQVKAIEKQTEKLLEEDDDEEVTDEDEEEDQPEIDEEESDESDDPIEEEKEVKLVNNRIRIPNKKKK